MIQSYQEFYSKSDSIATIITVSGKYKTVICVKNTIKILCP